MIDFTYYGHSCFSVVINEQTILFDPFITPNPAASAIDVNTLNPDFICITHGHEDHIADAEEIARRSGANILCNYEIYEWFAAKGLTNIQPLNHGGSIHLPFGKVKFVNAIHSSKLPDGSYGGNPGGFVIESSQGNFYYAGDTALTYDMKMLGEFHSIDWAVLPIGDIFTMGVEDAIICAKWIQSHKIIGVHFDTFEPITIDHAAAKANFEQQGISLTLPVIAETFSI